MQPHSMMINSIVNLSYLHNYKINEVNVLTSIWCLKGSEDHKSYPVDAGLSHLFKFADVLFKEYIWT